MRNDLLAPVARLNPWRVELLEHLHDHWCALPSHGSQDGTFAPEFDVRQTDDALIVQADLPGVDETDLEISLDFNRLVVHGRRRTEPLGEGEIIHGEVTRSGSFIRSFILPTGCNADESVADLRYGVLTITVPLVAEARPRKIPLTRG